MSDELKDGVGLEAEASGRLVIGGFLLIFVVVATILATLAREPETNRDYSDVTEKSEVQERKAP